MIRFFLVISLLCLNLFAVSIISNNLYDRDDRVDLMLSFDAPFNGEISQQKLPNITTVRLGNTNIEKPYNKTLLHDIVQEISIKNSEVGCEIQFNNKKAINVIASKTVDGYGLRLRIKLSAISQTESPQKIVEDEHELKNIVQSNQPQSVPLQKQNSQELLNIDLEKYIYVISLMIVLIAILLVVKRYFNTSKKDNQSWLFKDKSAFNISVVSQKMLDQKNKAMLIELNGVYYLVMIGNSNIVLDKFTNKKVEENEFEDLLSKNQAELDTFLELENKNSSLDDFKLKASREFFRM
ncbi:MAG: hypothetical protein HXX81_05250 [Campylobacterales bacterium]|nr:hypothetical protein [Campylobacterales bacterium]